jgi:hypothetical protein
METLNDVENGDQFFIDASQLNIETIIPATKDQIHDCYMFLNEHQDKPDLHNRVLAQIKMVDYKQLIKDKDKQVDGADLKWDHFCIDVMLWFVIRHHLHGTQIPIMDNEILKNKNKVLVGESGCTVLRI